VRPSPARIVAQVTFVGVLALVLASPIAFRGADEPLDGHPNVVVIVTDDQPFDSLPHDPPTMPYLQARLQDPSDHWVVFPNAFVEVPLCCPSRTTILTGQTVSHTGVRSNEDGWRFDETSTLATWLRKSGYTTALIGKYLNGYPFGRGPYVPPGWSRWFAKQQGDATSVYHDFTIVENGVPVPFTGAAYSTDVFTGFATEFLRTVPTDRPFFLYLTPTAPHSPWVPPLRYAGAFDGVPMPESPAVLEDVTDKPAWVRALPVPTEEARARWIEAHRHSYEALLGVDDGVRSVLETLETEGMLDDTVVFFLTDNGFSFGEHRWVAKSCPYDACVRTPFAVRVPGVAAHADDRLISLIDIAPTIAALGGAEPTTPVDGLDMTPLLDGSATSWRTGLLTEFEGDDVIPPWFALRTAEGYTYVEYATGERELYDARTDPLQLSNLADDPAFADLVARLSAELAALRGA
jgi:N-acetylglucosamine-6-sulfatase